MASYSEIMGQQKFSKKNRKAVRVYKKKGNKHETFREEVEHLKKRYDEIDTTDFETFEQLPLSSQTLAGLKKNGYSTLTDIQRESIGLALKGNDILGAAKTGSGKTLAFVIPVLECLYREGWSRPAGLGALVITPTRELAYQIFEVFNKVGKFHDFTVALVIGGKDIDIERKVLNQYNIVICTPGRLLQHMDENPLFDSLTLQILVLDEADRILDLGFANTMNAIIEHLPQERQTLLFSATQTKSVKDLARLSLKDPKYVSVHEHAKYITPESLMQSYLVCEAHEKINFLWSFLKRHKKQKILVFMASCKQVKYAFEAFCRMQPGISVTALYGSLHQLKRMEKYRNFCRKENIVMFATDIAARGLDFPNVNWVLQLDCPEDVNTYIHRAGRTARYREGGESLLVLLPSEKDSMLEQMEARRIPITEIQVNPKELFSVTKRMATICSNDQNLLQSAQRAFNAYLKSIFLMKDKTVFDVRKINMEAYARSLGLLITPRTRFINKHLKIKSDSQHVPQTSLKASENSYSECKSQSALNSDSHEDIAQNQLKSQLALEATVNGSESVNSEDENEDLVDALEKESAQSNLESAAPDETWDFMDSSDEYEDIISQLNIHPKVQDTEGEGISKKKPVTKFALAKKILKKIAKPNVKVVFDEEGEVVGGLKLKAPIPNEATDETFGGNGTSIESLMYMVSEADKMDKESYKMKVKGKHRERKNKLKELRRKRDLREQDELSEDDSRVDRQKSDHKEQKEELSDGDSEDDFSSRRERLKRYVDELPDPDKYFDKVSESENEEDDIQEFVTERLGEDSESISESEQLKQKQKRTKKKRTESSRKRRKLSKELPSTIGPTVALGADEEFALNLLQIS